MADVHRVMRADPNDPKLPKVGASFGCLGVRIPKDIQPDSSGNVRPEGKGLSVEPSLQAIGIFMVPQKYCHLLEGAIGDDKYSVWIPRGAQFQDGPIAPKLQLTCDSPLHGVIEPDSVMPVAEFQAAIAATQRVWIEI